MLFFTSDTLGLNWKLYKKSNFVCIIDNIFSGWKNIVMYGPSKNARTIRVVTFTMTYNLIHHKLYIITDPKKENSYLNDSIFV